MTTTVLAGTLSVTAGIVDLTPYVIDASWSHTTGPAEASLALSELPSTVNRWDEITITGGIVGRTVSQRFGGYVADSSTRHYAPIVTLKAVGYLSLASRILSPVDELAEYQDEQAAADNLATTGTYVDSGTVWTTYIYPTATGTAAEYLAAGYDLSSGGAGQTDAAIVTLILGECGLTGKLGTIGGLSHVLGTQAREQYVWARKQTGADAIKTIDDIALGHRTMDATDGTIKRQLASPRTPGYVSAVTLTEGVDILEGASVADQTAQLANRVLVEGWLNDGVRRIAAVAGEHPSLPPGVTHESKSYRSLLIEKAFAADIGQGLSCEEVALWHLGEDSTLWVKATIPTWRDDVINPGDQITVEAPHLNLSGAAWVASVRASMSNGKVWHQELTVIARKTAVVEALLGTMVLPASLAVNP